MLKRTMRWIGQQTEKFGRGGKTLDIGSHNVNGGVVASFDDYTGIDLCAGSNVTIVMDAYNISLHFNPESFDRVLCLYTLEHMPDIKKILTQINYVLKKGGQFYVSVPLFGYPTHGYPGDEGNDYWRFSEETVRDYIMKDYEILAMEHGRGNRPGGGPVLDCLGRKL